MEDLTEKLNNILNNPEILNNLQNFSGLLGPLSSNINSQDNNQNNNSQEQNINNSQDNNNLELMNMMLKLAPILSELKNNQNDKNIKFLNALRPLLSEPKQKKLDTAIPFLKILKILPILRDNNILNF